MLTMPLFLFLISYVAASLGSSSISTVNFLIWGSFPSNERYGALLIEISYTSPYWKPPGDETVNFVPSLESRLFL